MSLINDALKRAHQQQQNQPPHTPGAPLQPVSYEPRGPNPWIFFAVIPLVILLLGVAGWFLLSPTKSKTVRDHSVNAVKSATIDIRQTPEQNVADRVEDANPAARIALRQTSGKNFVEAPAVELRPAPPAPEAKPRVLANAPAKPAIRTNLAALPKSTPVSASASKETAAVKSLVVSSPPALVAAEKPPVTPPPAETNVAFPILKLQGIYYRLNNPSVLINGRTLFIGDRIEGARVVNIERQNVTVEFGGQRKVLEL